MHVNTLPNLRNRICYEDNQSLIFRREGTEGREIETLATPGYDQLH